MHKISKSVTSCGQSVLNLTKSGVNRRPLNRFTSKSRKCHGWLVYSHSFVTTGNSLDTSNNILHVEQLQQQTDKEIEAVIEHTLGASSRFGNLTLSSASGPVDVEDLESFSESFAHDIEHVEGRNHGRSCHTSPVHWINVYSCDNVSTRCTGLDSQSDFLRNIRDFSLGSGRLNSGHVNRQQYNQKRWYSGGRSSTHYYDVLGVTPKATQKDIKDAYYSLSKLYHPDIKSDSASEHKFAELSEAYEVLGNKRRKRLYDRGLLNPLDRGSGHAAAEVDENIDEDVFKRGSTASHFKKRGPIPTGKSEIYDFDEFYKQHYGDSFRRSQQQKKGKEELEEFNAGLSRRQRVGFYGSFFIAGLFMASMLFGGKNKEK